MASVPHLPCRTMHPARLPGCWGHGRAGIGPWMQRRSPTLRQRGQGRGPGPQRADRGGVSAVSGACSTGLYPTCRSDGSTIRVQVAVSRVPVGTAGIRSRGGEAMIVEHRGGGDWRRVVPLPIVVCMCRPGFVCLLPMRLILGNGCTRLLHSFWFLLPFPFFPFLSCSLGIYEIGMCTSSGLEFCSVGRFAVAPRLPVYDFE